MADRARPAAAAAAWQLLEQPDFAGLEVKAWAALVYGGALAFGLAYVCWFAALRRLPASVATIGSLLAPVVGVLASVALLGDPFGLREIGALALTLGGVALATFTRSFFFEVNARGQKFRNKGWPCIVCLLGGARAPFHHWTPRPRLLRRGSFRETYASASA